MRIEEGFAVQSIGAHGQRNDTSSKTSSLAMIPIPEGAAHRGSRNNHCDS